MRRRGSSRIIIALSVLDPLIKRSPTFCFQVSKEELAKLVQSFEEQDILTSSGVTLAGSRYIYLSGTDRVIRAKLGKVGVHCMKTTQAVVVSLYEDPIQPQQAASVVEKLGEYLVSCGY